MTRLEELRDAAEMGGHVAARHLVLELAAIEIERAKDDDLHGPSVSGFENAPPKPQLLPCPSCGGEARVENPYVECNNAECVTCGPSNDPTGEKWNALPRKCKCTGWEDFDTGEKAERKRCIELVTMHFPPCTQRMELLRDMGVTDDPN